jgi:hypothetical protein
MGKSILIVLACLTHQAYSQIRTGTVVVIHYTANKIIVAADSRQTAVFFFPNIPPDDTECKVAAFRHQLIFATAGAETSKLGPIAGWSNINVVREALHKTPDGDIDLEKLVKAWGELVAEDWKFLFAIDPNYVRRIAEHGHGLLTEGVFLLEKSSDVLTSFIAIKMSGAEIQWYSAELPCSADGSFCGIGRTDTFRNFLTNPSQFGPEVTDWDTPRPPLDLDEWRTIKLVLLTANHETSVGGPIDAVEIVPKDAGRVHWISRKDGCAENTD